MNKSSTVPIVGIIISLLAIAIPAYIQYDLYVKSEPEKTLLLKKEYSENKLGELNYFGENVLLKINNEKINNLYIVEATIENIGKIPVIPTDFVEPLTISIQNPWKIINITNSKPSNSYKSFNWSRSTNNQFTAKPTLLNPGDTFKFNIYLTNPEINANTGEDVIAFFSLRNLLNIDTRIINLDKFTTTEKEKNKQPFYASWGLPISMCHEGFSFTFILIVSPILFTTYLYILRDVSYLSDLSSRSLLIIAFFGLISFSGIESLATILFGEYQCSIDGIYKYTHSSNWLNVPPVVINSIIFIYLLYRKKSLIKANSAN